MLRWETSAMETDRGTGLRELNLPECFDLLASVNRGHLAITYQALPAIVPVRLEFRGEEVVIASLLGQSVLIVTPNVVALEAGNLGEGLDREWTVEVCGFLRELEPSLGTMGLGTSDKHKDFFTVTTDHVRGWTTF
jgi:hypothetical protein